MSNSEINYLNEIVSFIWNLEGDIDKADKETLINHLKPTIAIRTTASEDEALSIGSSKIGGKPDLPIETEWPRANGKPMLFCAQYNLSEAQKFDKEGILPKKGFFYIFLSLNEEWQDFNGINQPFEFIYSESDNLGRRDFPEDLEGNRRFKSAKINYYEFYTLPHFENHKLHKLYRKYDLLWIDFLEPVNDFINYDLYEYNEQIHQLLGHDRSIQTTVVNDFAAKDLGIYGATTSEYEKQKEAMFELAKTYELLLQLDCCDSNTDLSRFGGSGTYYFGLSRTDLEKRNFSNIKMAFQMT